MKKIISAALLIIVLLTQAAGSCTGDDCPDGTTSTYKCNRLGQACYVACVAPTPTPEEESIMPKSISYFARPPAEAPDLGAWCSIWRYLPDGSINRHEHYNLSLSSQHRLVDTTNKMMSESGAVLIPGINGWSLYP